VAVASVAVAVAVAVVVVGVLVGILVLRGVSTLDVFCNFFVK
jgi:hypothetical protein